MTLTPKKEETLTDLVGGSKKATGYNVSMNCKGKKPGRTH
jgi:hypothetical protein